MKLFKYNKIVFKFLVLILGLSFAFQNCSDGVDFGKSSADNGNSGQLGNGQDPVDNGIPSGDHPVTGNGGRDPSVVQRCDHPAFAGMDIKGECLLLFDTFDRAQVTGAGQFNWSQFIDDSARSDALNVQANIFKTNEFGMGESLHEEHAVYVTGRKGGSVHEVYLISKALDLKRFDEMNIEFNYLPIHLEQWNWNGERGHEHIRLDICSNDLEDCVGRSGDSRSQERALKSNSWRPLFLQPGFTTGNLNATQAGDNNTGRNHIEGTWHLGRSGTIDLNSSLIPDKSQVVFRISVMLDEGFKGTRGDGSPNFNSELEDGMGIDYVKVFAIGK